MALKTAQEYLDTIKKMTPRVYCGGKWVKNLLDNPVTRSMVMANAAMYGLAEDPQHKEVMVATSHLTGEPINRNLNVARNIHDLDMRQEMALLTSQTVGTCNYRCVGCDALNSLAATTWEMDRDLGTKYNERFNKWLAYAQANDLAVSGAITDAKGDRKKRPSQQDEIDSFVHLVEKRDDGIVVSGIKVSQSGAIGSHETLVLPGGALREGEESFALAFAVQNSAPGLTYICQYNAYSAEREMCGDEAELGNPIYGQRETSTMVFDKVFIPWDRVFLCGETKYCGRMVTRFAKAHRMNCGGACKVGFADLIIGGTMLAAEYIGVDKVPHIQEKIIDMVRLSETSHACAIAAAMRGTGGTKGIGRLPAGRSLRQRRQAQYRPWILGNHQECRGYRRRSRGDGAKAEGSGRSGGRSDAEEGLLSGGPGREAAQGRQVPAALVSRSARTGNLARRRRPPDPAVHDLGLDRF